MYFISCEQQNSQVLLYAKNLHKIIRWSSEMISDTIISYHGIGHYNTPNS